MYFKSCRRKSVVLLSQIKLTWRHRAEPGKQIFAIVKPQIYVLHVVSEKIIKNFSQSRDFYGPWQPCWITNRNNTWLDHANEHSGHVWSHLLQWFSRRRLKCLRTDDGRQVMAIAHLWVRWAKHRKWWLDNQEVEKWRVSCLHS